MLDAYGQEVLSPADAMLAPPEPTLEACRWWPPLPRLDAAEGVRLPNLFEWQPGDIVLYSGNVAGKDTVASAIEKAQRLRFRQQAARARWVHAAVYLGWGLCVESVRAGVQVKLHGLGERLALSLVRVRRLRESGTGKPWSAHLGRDVAHSALSYLGEPYAAKTKLVKFLTGPESARVRRHEAGSQAKRRESKSQAKQRSQEAAVPLLPKEGVFCSEMCRHALNAAAYVDFVYNTYKLDEPSPGLLSQSSLLADIPVRWHEATAHAETAYV